MANFQTLVLAAGRGSRLKELTNDRPKCFVEINGTPLIEHIINEIRAIGSGPITIVTGYKNQAFNVLNDIKEVHNPSWSSTNMLNSLLMGLVHSHLDLPLVVVYSDIFLQSQHIKDTLSHLGNEIICPSYAHWKSLWQSRMDNPLEDLETFKVTKKRLLEIGNKPDSLEDIQGQFMGILAIPHKKILNFKKHLEEYLNKNNHDSKSTTEFLNHMINKGITVDTFETSAIWAEFDSPEDIKQFNQSIK